MTDEPRNGRGRPGCPGRIGSVSCLRVVSPLLLVAVCAAHACQAPPPGKATLLRFGGYAGLSDVGGADGTATGLCGSVGGELGAHVDLTGRMTFGDVRTDEPVGAYGSELDGSTVFLDFALRGHGPIAGPLRWYGEGFYGYGFLDPPMDSSLDGGEGPSWGLGSGVVYPLGDRCSVSAGVEYRHASWHLDDADDFQQNDVALRIDFTVRLPGPVGFGPIAW